MNKLLVFFSLLLLTTSIQAQGADAGACQIGEAQIRMAFDVLIEKDLVTMNKEDKKILAVDSISYIQNIATVGDYTIVPVMEYTDESRPWPYVELLEDQRAEDDLPHLHFGVAFWAYPTSGTIYFTCEDGSLVYERIKYVSREWDMDSH